MGVFVKVYVLLRYCLDIIMLQIILLSDLECDFLNTKQGCNKLNQVHTSEHHLSSTVVLAYLKTFDTVQVCLCYL